MGFLVSYLGEILQDMFDTLKAWTCWLFDYVTQSLVDFCLYLIDFLPPSEIDIGPVQWFIDAIFLFNDALPVVEFLGMYAAYFTWRIMWGSFNLLMWMAPAVGGR